MTKIIKSQNDKISMIYISYWLFGNSYDFFDINYDLFDTNNDLFDINSNYH